MLGDRIRIYDGTTGQSSEHPEFSRAQLPPPGVAKLTVPLREIAPALADALAAGRIWLQDFENEEVTISRDLYEIILAYQHLQRLSA